MYKGSGFKTASIGLFFWCLAVLIRSTISENIHPWQFHWCMWVLSTSFTSGMIGWGLCLIWQRRKLERNAGIK